MSWDANTLLKIDSLKERILQSRYRYYTPNFQLVSKNYSSFSPTPLEHSQATVLFEIWSRRSSWTSSNIFYLTYYEVYFKTQKAAFHQSCIASLIRRCWICFVNMSLESHKTLIKRNYSVLMHRPTGCLQNLHVEHIHGECCNTRTTKTLTAR